MIFGFVAGALVSALLNLAGRFNLIRIFVAIALLATPANALIAVLEVDFGTAIALRFMTGFGIARVYPPDMKLVATWREKDRWFGIGLLVGTLTLGASLPHLLNALPDSSDMPSWRTVLEGASWLAFALTVLCLIMIWGFAVVTDSAQFSAAVSELGDPRYVGTALTVQTSLGFLLTAVTILLIPLILDAVGWRYVFLVLAPGPAFGVWAMRSLRRLPEAKMLASGNRGCQPASGIRRSTDETATAFGDPATTKRIRGLRSELQKLRKITGCR